MQYCGYDRQVSQRLMYRNLIGQWQTVQVCKLRRKSRSVEDSKGNLFLSLDFTQNLGFCIRRLLFVGTVYEVLIPTTLSVTF